MMFVFLYIAASSEPASQPASMPVFNLLEGTAAGSMGIAVTPGIEAFGQYAARITPPNDWFHRFDLTRGHASLQATWSGARARFVLEAVRSATEGALIGVATDSFVFRVREAFAGYARDFGPYGGIDIRAGVVPTLVIPSIERTWGLRAVAPVAQETTGLASPADLGATARYLLPREYGWVAVGAYNGEGYNGRELNRGKNIEAAIELHFLAATEALKPLAVLFAYQWGSSGTGGARSDRLNTAILWQGDAFRAGASMTYGWGIADRGDQTSLLVEAFVRGELWRRLILGARFSHWLRDTSRADTERLSIILGTVGVRIVQPLETFVAVSRSLPGASLAASIPGQDHWELRLVARVVF